MKEKYIQISFFPVKKEKNKIEQSYFIEDVNQGEINNYELEEYITNKTKLSVQVIKTVLGSLRDALAIFTKDGNVVHLDNIGSFHLTVYSVPSELPEEVDESNFKHITINFEPSKKLIDEIQSRIEFVREDDDE